MGHKDHNSHAGHGGQLSAPREGRRHAPAKTCGTKREGARPESLCEATGKPFKRAPALKVLGQRMTGPARTAAAMLLALLAAHPAHAGQRFLLPPGTTVVGHEERYVIRGDESLHEAALRHGIGFNEITGANPAVEPLVPGDGTEVLIPKRFVLPGAPRRGIVVNLAEMRLYHYAGKGDDGAMTLTTYPVGIGREGLDTPEGSFVIVEKLINPYWIVPPSVREEQPELPPAVPPGDEKNPLGKFAMRLSDPLYLIHGTNMPLGIGRRVSHGCIRMYPADIRELYDAAPLGTEVRVVYQPLKVGALGDTVYLEFHEDYRGALGNPWEAAAGLLQDAGLMGGVDSELLHRALRRPTGVPVPLSRTLQ